MQETNVTGHVGLWRRLITPHPAVAGAEERRTAQLTIALVLCLLFLLVLGLVILPLADPLHRQGYSVGLGVMLGILLCSYALALTPRYRLGIGLLLVSLLLFPIAVLYLVGDRSPVGVRNAFLWMVLTLGVGSMLVPVKRFPLFAAIAVIELLSIPLLAVGVSLPAVTTYLVYTLAVVVLLVVGFRHYAELDRAHQSELMAANRRLQALNQELHSRTLARTAEVSDLERKSQALAENNPLAIIRLDRDLRFVYLNPAGKRVFGPDHSDTLANARLGELHSDPDTAVLGSFLASSVLGVFDTGADAHTQSSTGMREFEWWLVAEYDGHGRVATVLVTGMDVTERQRVERQVIESEARFRAISDAAPMGIYVDAPNGACVYFNNTFQSISGLSDQEILDGRRDEIIHPDDRERLLGMRRESLTSSPYAFESVYRFLRRDGRVVWVNSKEVPMWDGGNLMGFVGVVEDITAKIEEINARLEADETLRRRSGELETALSELEGFSYTVAHDLRAPLRAIDGFANILQREYRSLLPTDGLRLLGTIRSSAQQMGVLIDDLLSFSRLGRQSLNLQMVNMSAIVGQVIDVFAAEREGREIEIKVDSLQPCHGDPALLRQVWLNLLSNALKFTRHQEKAVIEIGCSSATGKQVTYFVRDNGAGFDMAFANKLFGVFQRLHRPDEFEGTGVGLAIVQRVVQRHEGKAWARGAVDGGATFYFSIPGKPRENLETPGAVS
jgi:PAS domain S-box-containing protein